MHSMLNEFYDFIAKKINSFFQAAAADGTLLKGESFCLKLDNEEMVTEVANALEELATSNQSKGEYVFPCGDGTLYKTYTLKLIDDEVIIAAQINGMTNDFLCATLRNAANEQQKPLLMISANPIDSAKSGSRDMSASGMPFYAENLMTEIRQMVNDSTQLTNTEKRILSFELTRRDADVFSDKASIYEYKDLLAIMSSGKIEVDNFPGFRLFTVDGKVEYQTYSNNQIDKEIKNNNELFEMIDRSIRYGNIEVDLSRVFENRFIDRIEIAHKNEGENWSRLFTYAELIAAKEKFLDKIGKRMVSLYNALMQVESSGNPYQSGTSISTQIDEKAEDKMEYIYGNSNWVVFVDPKVDLDFFSEKEAKSDLLIIHYSDQYTSSIDDDTVVIVEENIAKNAVELLPLLFSNYKFYYEEDNEDDYSDEETREFESCCRKKIYRYNNVEELDRIIFYAKINDIPIATFSQANGELRKEFEQFNKSSEEALLDLTSVSYALEDNKTLIYALEQFLAIMPNIRIIAQTVRIDVLLRYFPLFLEGQESIGKLFPDLSDIGVDEQEGNTLKKVTDFSKEDFDAFIDAFNHNLIGHNYFKNRLQYILRNFICLNKAKEQKVLSIFLFGASGIGKTEVARLMANGLQSDCYLAKINFQNYSSQDALNSLIGSPAGYVGCNYGELSEKVKKSKVGILLCDEFEKTTRPVYSFFLELLEEGHFTDSMAREYDMDGYVIIFTSNLLSEAEYKKEIPPELQTRFDLVCEFEKPEMSEKIAFLELLLEKARNKYSEQFARIEMTEQEKTQLFDFDYASLSALRDIKRIFNNRLMDYFIEKGVM